MARTFAMMLLCAALLRGSCFFAHAAVIARWDFNSFVADSNPETGTLVDAAGTGMLCAPIGQVNDSFGSVGGGVTSDTNREDNTQLRLTHFPPAFGFNKNAGIQCRASTAGYRNISLRWDQYNSATSSRYWRVQYTTNSSEWIDADLIVVTNASIWTSRTVTFAAPGTEDNPAFGIRLVAEKESSAAGRGTNAYIAVRSGSNYSTAGTCWLDMLTLSGEPINSPAPMAPVISEIGDTTILSGRSANIPIAFSDEDSPPAAVALTAASSDARLLTLTLDGSGTNRMLTVQGQGARTGTATVTIRATDPDGLFSERSFLVRVLPKNTAPVVSAFTNIVSPRNTEIGPLLFEISDREQSAAGLTLSILCDNEWLFPPGNISVHGSGTNWSLLLLPRTNATGHAEFSIVAGDGELFGSSSFQVEVIATNRIVAWNFNSPEQDGDPVSGTTDPSFGTGSFRAIGGVNLSFGSVGGGATSDEAEIDNTMVRFSSFPAQGTATKTAGFEIRADTRGYGAIVLEWDQFNSGSASAFWRIQYSTNGTDFTDLTVITNSRASTWHKRQQVSLDGVPGVENNRHLALRFVSEFEGSATGEGGDSYRAVDAAASYSRSGTLWIDSVRLLGERIPIPNSPPVIAQIPDQRVTQNAPFGGIHLSIEDEENSELTVTAGSSDHLVVPNSALRIASTNQERILFIDTAAIQPGNALITIYVRDGDATVSGSFLLTIEAADPPVPPAELRLSFAYSRDEGLIIRWPSGRDAVLETCNDFEGEWSAVSATEEVAGETIFRVGESGGASGFFRLHFPDQRVP